MLSISRAWVLAGMMFGAAVAWPGCKGQEKGSGPGEQALSAAPAQKKPPRQLTLAAYTTPREAYGNAIIPAFKKYWQEKTGEDVEFKESYLGSGAQSRAIIGGFEADIAALSLEPDIQRIVEAGLITRDWKKAAHGGMVSQSVVVLGVRPSNPKGIKNWDDLAKPGLNVLTPNVKTSGGAMWNAAAIYGAAMRGFTKAAKADEKAAQDLIASIFANVSIMDKGARESILTFEKGVGDVAITYENEMRVSVAAGKPGEYVIPASTILIENPAAVVDKYAEKHGVKDLADAFIEFLHRPETQRAFVQHGLRPLDDGQSKDLLEAYPKLGDVFTVRDFGDWKTVTPKLFEKDGLYDRALASKVQGR